MAFLLRGGEVVTIALEPATSAHWDSTFAWVKAEADAGRDGLFDDRETIERRFAKGDGFCAVHGSRSIGFVVFQHHGDISEVHDVGVHPDYRRQGIARRLMVAAEARLTALGSHCLEVVCTTLEGEALCRRHGFNNVQDSSGLAASQGLWARPTLRKYLSDWRPGCSP